MILIRIFERIAKMSFVPLRVVTRYQCGFSVLNFHSPPGNHSKPAFSKYSKNVNEGHESDSKIEFRMLSKQNYLSIINYRQIVFRKTDM